MYREPTGSGKGERGRGQSASLTSVDFVTNL